MGNSELQMGFEPPRVVGSNPIWSADLFRVSHDAKTYRGVICKMSVRNCVLRNTHVLL